MILMVAQNEYRNAYFLHVYMLFSSFFEAAKVLLKRFIGKLRTYNLTNSAYLTYEALFFNIQKLFFEA